jgi:hypothetical protein
LVIVSCCTASVGESDGERDSAHVGRGSDLKNVSWESRTVRGAGSLNPDSSSLSSVRLGSGTPCRQLRSDIGCVSGEAWISAMSACALWQKECWLCCVHTKEIEIVDVP